MMLVKYDQGAVEAKTLVPWGNSPDPVSPHYADQAPLFAQRKHKRVILTRDEVESHLESRLELDVKR